MRLGWTGSHPGGGSPAEADCAAGWNMRGFAFPGGMISAQERFLGWGSR